MQWSFYMKTYARARTVGDFKNKLKANVKVILGELLLLLLGLVTVFNSKTTSFQCWS